jgi:hypothetical protein
MKKEREYTTKDCEKLIAWASRARRVPLRLDIEDT